MADQILEQFNFTHRIPNALRYTAHNQEQAIQIDRLHGIRALTLYAHGQFDVTGNNNAVATAEPRYVTDMRLTVGGGTVLWAGDWQSLYRVNTFDYGANGVYTNNVNGAPANNVTYSSIAIIDLQEVFAKAPIDTALVSRLFSSIELRARIGGATDLQTGADGVDFDTFQIDVSMSEVINMKQGFGRFVKKVSFVERELTTSQTEFTIPLPTGNMIKKILVRSFVDCEPVNTIINNLKVVVGGEVLYDLSGAMCRGEQLLRKQINTQPDGYHLIDFNPDIILSEGANLSKVASLGCNLILDCTFVQGTDLIRAVVTEIMPVS